MWRSWVPKSIRQKNPVPDPSRVPPGQFVSEKFPVMTYGPSPHISMERWRLRLFGLVEEVVEFTWEQFLALPQTKLDADFHCVTQWSLLGATWEGVAFREVMEHVQLKPEARYVMAHCYEGYTANLPLETLMADEAALLCHRMNGEPLAPAHGGPMRLLVPSRYGWKSAKWLMGLEFKEEDEPGFWEQRGYHMDGDPWKEERFG